MNNLQEELDLPSESSPIECEVTVTDAEEESLDFLSSISESVVHEEVSSLVTEEKTSEGGKRFQDLLSKASVKMTLEANISASRELISAGDTELRDRGQVAASPSGDESFAVCKVSPMPVSQSLSETHDRLPSSINLSVCACGDADCIDGQFCKLVLVKSYLAAGEAYKKGGQLDQALEVVQLACSVYESIPRHLEDSTFISSVMTRLSLQEKPSERNEKTILYNGDAKDEGSSSNNDCLSSNNDHLTFELFSSTYYFSAKAWTLVGDVYAQLHIKSSKEITIEPERKSAIRELKMSSEVVKEVKRVKKKLGQYNQNCSSCSLVNCRCQSDRASSGGSAGSSNSDLSSIACGRKQTEKSNAKSTSMVASQTEIVSREIPEVKNGGIFKCLGGPVVGDADYLLLAALSCFEEARKALGGLSSGSAELQSVVKKVVKRKGRVCKELGRIRIERQELNRAQHAFADAINAFREISDHTNIIRIYCNLGHARRALGDETVLKIEDLKIQVSKSKDLKIHAIFRNAHYQAMETAKIEYIESLRYYGAAKSELNFIAEEAGSVTNSMRDKVYTQFANTYLRLGVLLSKEDTTAEVYENEALENACVDYTSPSKRKARKKSRKHEISANDALRKALSLYELQLRKEEAADAYLQLAGYERNCFMKLLESDNKKSSLSKGENSILQQVKQHVRLAERNLQKAMDFYGPSTHPTMYLTILMERSALLSILSSVLQSNEMMESTLSHMLEGRYVSDNISEAFKTNFLEVQAEFWRRLQNHLKRMLATAISAGANKSPSVSQPNPESNRSRDAGKLKELYKMSLKSTEMSQLHTMYELWTS